MEETTFAAAIREGLSLGDDDKALRGRLRGGLTVVLPAKNGGRARAQTWKYTGEYDMRYLKVRIAAVHDHSRGNMKIHTTFTLCAFEDGNGEGRNLHDIAPAQLDRHITPEQLRDALAKALAKVGDIDGLKISA